MENGPDQILPAENITTTDPEGCVKIRDHFDETLEYLPPISVISMFRNTVVNHGERNALRVKRNGIWQEWTYKMYWNEAKIVAKAFIKLGERLML